MQIANLHQRIEQHSAYPEELGGTKGSLVENETDPNLMNQSDNTTSTYINNAQLEKAKTNVINYEAIQKQQEAEVQKIITDLVQVKGIFK